MIRRFKGFISSQQFNPGFFGLFLNPFYFARKELHKEIKKFASEMRGDLLDVGCGSKPYQTLFFNATKYIGLEFDSPANRKEKKADYFYDGRNFPFPDKSYDGVICNQVLEHVFNADEFIKQISRVLNVNGKLLLTVPFVWDEHEQPWDFARYSTFGMKDLLERHGFQVLAQNKTNADVRILFQLINTYLYKVCITRNSKFNILIFIFLMGPFNLMGVLLAKILPLNPDLFLDQVILAQKKN